MCLQFLIETTPAESIVTYIGLLASIVLLLLSFIIFCVLRGALQTNSKNIHKNLAFCLFVAQLIFLTALKLRQQLIVSEARRAVDRGGLPLEMGQGAVGGEPRCYSIWNMLVLK